MNAVQRLVVDGYNIVHAWPRLRDAIRAGGLEDARLLLVRALAEYAARTATEVTVVFDSHGRDGRQQEEAIDGVRVLFASKRASADHVIERLAYEAAQRGSGVDVVVATNDRLTRDVVGAMGVPRMSASALEAELERVVRVDPSPGHHDHPHRLEDRLSPEVRRRLEALRRGADR